MANIPYDRLECLPKGSLVDKGHCIQFSTETHPEIIDFIWNFILDIGVDDCRENEKQYKELDFFIQGRSNTWILLEAWGGSDDLYLDFFMYFNKLIKERFNI